MTNEQINEAITQATGLWDYPYSNETRRMYDFCSDLNAMHEAEKVLRANQWYDYALRLNEDCWHWALIHAAARQRAEAFLRTLGKWEEAE